MTKIVAMYLRIGSLWLDYYQQGTKLLSVPFVLIVVLVYGTIGQKQN